MAPPVVLGVDIGTSSSKGVLVDPRSGRILAEHALAHDVTRPRSGWAEMDPALWWQEFVDITRQLLRGADAEVIGIGVSGMGPCAAVADEQGRPLRPAILYGIDTRATAQIAALEVALGRDEVLTRCGSLLSTQSVGPKLQWIAEHEPEVADQVRYLFMPSSWLVWNLTGQYVLDHHSASQCTPMYDLDGQDWYIPWAKLALPGLQLPPLRWPGEIAGQVSAAAAAMTGLPVGTPVITGTIDAWAEAISGDAHRTGDLMLMYGSTMFLINTVPTRITFPSLWSTNGAIRGTHSLAGGMASSGAITNWLRRLFDGPSVPELLTEAEHSGPGARGLLMLPYFAGERTPIADPDARGLLAGLTLSHRRGDLYRAALEATAFGIRHNVEALRDAGAAIDRVIAIGGGTQGRLWTQIVSDVTGLQQQMPSQTVGASYGSAFLAASAVGHAEIGVWNPVREVRLPEPRTAELYHDRYALYRQLYLCTAPISHELAATQS